jgi:tetratricopeptide (TPR) repeat protein
MVALAAAAVPAAAQVADPKAEFIQALGQFSLALDGKYGDEGSSIRSSLASLERGLAQWDTVIRTYEAAMAAEIRSAGAPLASRMHLALGGVYLERGRVPDAMREFGLAGQLEPGRADIQTLRGLAYSQLANDPAAATAAFRRASLLDPTDPVRAYVLARHLSAVGEEDEAAKVRQLFRANEKQRTSAGRAAIALPFVRLGLVQEVDGIEPFFPPVAYAEGFALLRQGAYQRAIAQFKDAAARDPLTTAPVAVAESTERAATAFRDGSVETAVQHLKAVVAVSPTHAEAHRILGSIYVADRQPDVGVDALRTAVGLSPDDERARLALADALVDSGEFPAAEQALRETLSTLPDSGRARYALARLYQRQGLYTEALREFDLALAFHPLLGLNGIYETMGTLMAAQQDFDGAIDSYNRQVDLHPNHAAAHQKLGETYFRQGRHEEALAEFDVVLMLSPQRAEAYAAAAQVHLREGHYADAADASGRALELNASHKEARYVRATSLIRLGKTEEGARELQRFERLQAEEMAARTRLFELEGLKREASVSAANGDQEKAVALRRQILVLAPTAADSYLDLGLALVKAEQLADAIEHFKAAVALDAHFDVHRHMAEAYAALGRLEESRSQQALFEQRKREALRRGARP